MKHLLLLPIIALAACHQAPEPSTKPSTATATPAVPIKGASVQVTEKNMPRYLRVTGQLIGKNDAVIAADAMGKVIEAPVERGTIVKAGDTLVKLDERQAKLALAEAVASLELAKAQLLLSKNEQQRNAPLAEKRAIADADFQRLVTDTTAREAQVAAAEARRDMVQKTLTDCSILAPFAGVVAERMVEPGEYVRSDSPVARVVDLASLRLVLNVPETEVGLLATDQTVEFNTPAFPDRDFKGTLKFLGAAMREASRDLVVEAAVDNMDGSLKPGFFCDARILLSEVKAAVVPIDALRVEGSRRKVFVIEKSGHLLERLVEVGETRDGFIEIRRGLTPGESVLLKPGADALDGAPFQPAS
ncbi:MAG: efflux RND transporter periplasmic adaptor subunit [Verrucomicrobiales bacterium]|nr:efflux RND transporter periplasmic adaptor subunit [Verrucomicrobiales bacterium]MCP5557415.1 efflux RND transporter periplasmic adaptor subunit [Verrucomicrobiaceae bacterium]